MIFTICITILLLFCFSTALSDDTEPTAPEDTSIITITDPPSQTQSPSTSESTPAVTPPATPTPTPTITQVPDAGQQSSQTQSTTNTESVNPSPTVENSVTPTVTPEDTSTPDSNKNPETTTSIEPSATIEPTGSSMPDESYVPEETRSPEQSPDPGVTESFEPSVTPTLTPEKTDISDNTPDPTQTQIPETTESIEPSSTIEVFETLTPDLEESLEISTFGMKVDPIEETYIITIPSMTVLDNETYTGQITVSASGIGEAQRINLSVSSQNNFVLCSENETVPYVLYTSNSQEALQNGAIAACFSESCSRTLNIKVTDEPEKNGKYTDVLTFTITAEE